MWLGHKPHMPALLFRTGRLIHEKKDVSDDTQAYQQSHDEVYEGFILFYFFTLASAPWGSIVLTTSNLPTSTCEQFLNLTLKNE
jgi:hypothetical protein